MSARSIAALNHLPDTEKRAIYTRFIPQEILDLFGISSEFVDDLGNNLLTLKCRPGSTDVVLDLRHVKNAEDPLLYAHLTDTMNGQIHVLLYIVNDPESPRFDVDKLPDGTPTEFGVFRRNIEAEVAAMEAGLAPGQVRRGLRMLNHSVQAFEEFVAYLGHDVYFIDPLAYHNAIVFERYGFRYQQGRRRMERIHAGFSPGGDLLSRLDSSSPFRKSEFAVSIRGRSWAIHDGIIGEPYTDIVMYKVLDVHAGINTFPDAIW
jgi:hypothetical protein